MNSRHLILLNPKVILAILSMGILLLVSSCEEDDGLGEVGQTPATISFNDDSLRISEDASAPLQVVMFLSKPLEEASTITLTVNDKSTASSADYATNPESESGTITLDLKKGAPIAVFEFTPKDNDAMGVNKSAVFTISDATNGLLLADSLLTTTVVIYNDENAEDNAVPAIATFLSSLEFDSLESGNISASQYYAVSATDLNSDITVTASDNFLVSLDNATFSSSVDLDYNIVNAGPMIVFVQFVANTGINQELSGTITHASPGASDVVVEVSATEVVDAPVELIFEDNFEYGTTPGNLTALSEWGVYQGDTEPIQYKTEGLSLAGYGGSDIGGAVTLVNGDGSREDVKRNITTPGTGAVYTSMLVNFVDAGSGDFFSSLRTGSTYFNRLYAKDDGSGNLLLGVARTKTGGGDEVYATTAYSYNITYLVVIKYDFSTKETSMFVMDAIPATEPEAPAAVANTGDEPANFEEVLIRQGSDVLTVTVDGIRIGETWEDVLGL